MDSGDVEAAKRRAAESAVKRVTDGMVVGLGTGSTAAYAIDALGRAVDSGVDVTGIPTSLGSRALARDAGVPLTALDADRPDLAIDGADQIVDGTLLKGGGGAHTREKLVDAAADRFLVVADERKVGSVLDAPVPLEVLPAARSTVATWVTTNGGTPTVRACDRKDGPVITDNGNVIIDADFGIIEDPNRLAAQLSEIPGLVDHGLFVGIADEIHVGTADGVEVTRRNTD